MVFFPPLSDGSWVLSPSLDLERLICAALFTYDILGCGGPEAGTSRPVLPKPPPARAALEVLGRRQPGSRGRERSARVWGRGRVLLVGGGSLETQALLFFAPTFRLLSLRFSNSYGAFSKEGLAPSATVPFVRSCRPSHLSLAFAAGTWTGRRPGPTTSRPTSLSHPAKTSRRRSYPRAASATALAAAPPLPPPPPSPPPRGSQVRPGAATKGPPRASFAAANWRSTVRAPLRG